MQVTATRLVQWAETKEAQGALPRLVRSLCFKADSTRQLAFPAGDSTYSPNWDAVALQFAEELGCSGPGVESPDRFWNTWSRQSEPAIRLDALFVDREDCRGSACRRHPRKACTSWCAPDTCHPGRQ